MDKIIYETIHTTTYSYNPKASVSFNELRLQPRVCPFQVLLKHAIDIQPHPSNLVERIDFFGNPLTFFSIEEMHEQLKITATNTVALSHPNENSRSSLQSWEAVVDQLQRENRGGLTQFVFDSTNVKRSARLLAFAKPSFPKERPLLEGVMDLNARIHEFEYRPNVTHIGTTPDQVLETRQGVCQDFAHVMIGCLRSLGLAASYVSGYIKTNPRLEKTKIVGEEASHAWVGVFIPELGWIYFDPTNNLLARNEHITLAWGRDYSDVVPVHGVYVGNSDQQISVSVEVCTQL